MAGNQPSLPNHIGTMKIYGHLIHTPADLTAAFPYGGTVLGNFSQIAWQVEGNALDITFQEQGPMVGNTIENAFGVRVVARLIEWNAEALAKIFPSAMITTGATTGYPLLTLSATSILAKIGTDRAAKILLAPDHPDREPALLMYNAVAMIRQVANVSHSLVGEDWGFPAIWKALPDAAGNIEQYGLLRDMTVSP